MRRILNIIGLTFVLSLFSCKPEIIDRKISPEFKAMVYDDNFLDLFVSTELKTLTCNMTSDCKTEEFIVRLKDSVGNEVFSYRLDLTSNQPTIHLGVRKVELCQLIVKPDYSDIDYSASKAINHTYLDTFSPYYSPTRQRIYPWVVVPARSLDYSESFKFVRGLGLVLWGINDVEGYGIKL